LAGIYRTGQYWEFVVHDRKTRLVRALPFRDRVVHHAICSVIEPLFEQRFISDSFACRVGKGTHRAADRLEHFLRCARTRWGDFYVLNADVHKYFQSIRHDALLTIIRRRIGDQRVLAIIEEIIASSHEPGEPGVGLPIGNLTSQLFANVYLDTLDHFVKEHLRCRYYVRYMDNFLLLGADKGTLHQWRLDIEHFLRQQLGLELNPKTAVTPAALGVEFVGYRLWPTHRLLRKDGIKRMRRRLRKQVKRYAVGGIELDQITRSIQSWIAHTKHACCYRLRQRVLSKQIFRRETWPHPERQTSSTNSENPSAG